MHPGNCILFLCFGPQPGENDNTKEKEKKEKDAECMTP